MRRTTLRFDKLHSLSRSEYEKYFSEVGLPEDAKEDRVILAMAFEDELLPILAGVEERRRNGLPFFAWLLAALQTAYMNVALNRMGLSEDAVRPYAVEFAEEVALSTFDHVDDPYYTSADRAVNVSATESNAINNQGDRVDAKDNGYTFKEWHSILDGREREWHHDADGDIVPIDEPFEVGGELLMYPLDTSLGATADNIANCRCWASYF